MAISTDEEDLPASQQQPMDVDNTTTTKTTDNTKKNNVEYELPSLIIPITSSTNGNNYTSPTKTGTTTTTPPSSGLFIEIFPEEISSIRPNTLATILKDERAPLKTWCDASLLYMKAGKREKESCDLLNAAVDTDEVMSGSNTNDRLRVLASAGIAALEQSNNQITDGSSEVPVGLSLLDTLLEGSKAAEKRNEDQKEELRALADTRFTKADSINQVNPMTWIGRGMLNLAQGRLDQARFFFENLTLRECGEILPALIGMAGVKYMEKDYNGALELYGKAMQKYPVQSGAPTRVGFGMACYRLGQIDRAKAAFRRAHDIDPENVNALVGIAILEMGSLDQDVLDPAEYRKKAENIIKMISMANLCDHTNAQVQNHLANHYFWKWTPVPGMVKVERGSNVVTGNMASSLEGGDRIRIGHDFETLVVLDGDEGGDDNTFKIKDTWKFDSAGKCFIICMCDLLGVQLLSTHVTSNTSHTYTANLKIWKKDYDRVVSLAKGAYNSTNIPEVQAESLYMLARVYHAQGDMEQANKFYDKACGLSPDLSPARFGLAQTLIWDESYDEASAHLRLLLGTCSNATDALAALGLLEVKSGKDRREAFVYLKKAIDLDPFNSDLILIEALALQQHESDYPLSLDRYRKAVRLLEAQSKVVPADVLTNMGVLCHETKQYDEALEMYGKALKAVETENQQGNTDESVKETYVRHKDNKLFWKYVDTDFRVKPCAEEKTKLTVASSQTDVESLGIKVGDDISLEDDVETTVKDISKGDDGTIQLTAKDSVDLEKESKVSVKQSNGRLEDPASVSIVFNLARLHESSGRIVPAVELHKAILKHHPSYVNSYLRLACIARDCGSLKDCSEWLKMAVAVAPGDPEVLTLVGNLHLSLCDWAPAQNVFDQLLQQKVPKVEAYSMLSLGNIYFNNLNTPKKYSKHLQHAADFYRRILQKDKANAYAANGLGTVLAEKGELFKAKEIFNRVREVSGDTIPDALLNLGHIYLAQKKHPEALQMYQSYATRTRSSSGAQTTSKSQDDDEAEVLLFIAFAYFDWARQTELFNNAKAAPADERYRTCIEYIEKAMKKSKRENVTLRYNWCLAKLQAANCVLQKVNRNIRRTAQEVKDALNGLEESLPILQTMLQWKEEGRKVAISKGMLQGVVNQCKHNIDSAKSHLKEDLQKEKDAETLRNFQRLDAETNEKQRALQQQLEEEEETRKMEESEQRAKQKMERVAQLQDGWKAEAATKATPKKKGKKGDAPPGGVDDEAGIFDTEVSTANVANLFDDSDDDDDDDNSNTKKTEEKAGDGEPPKSMTQQSDLFGDSSSEEEMEDEPASKKRENSDDSNEEEPASKKAKVDEEGGD